MTDCQEISAFVCKSFNCNSLSNQIKRRQVFHSLKKKNCDIWILVDTRFDPKKSNQIKAEWGGEAFFSSYSSNARGVAILIKKGFPCKIINTEHDPNGNFLAVLAEINGKLILITGIYGPNEDSPGFYNEQIFPLIDQFDPEYSLIGGDWNMVLDQSKDTHNYLHENNIQAKKQVLEKMEDYELTDSWRHFHPETKKFTWTKKTLGKWLG